MGVKAIPEGRLRVTPYLVVEGVPGVIEFMKQVFDAEQVEYMEDPEGRVAHAEMKIGDSSVMLGEAQEDWPAMPGMLYVYVEDCDATYQKGLEAGGESIMEPADQFHGDRYGGVRDKSGNQWWIVTHVEDVSPEEIEKRHAEMYASNE